MASKNSIIIGITGPSCAGKSSLSNLLAEKLGKADVAVIPIDSYYRDLSHLEIAERERQNFDLPDAIEHELLIKHIRELARGKQIERPVWQFDRHTRAEATQTVKPEKFILIEGIFALYWEDIRALSDLKVFVTLDEQSSLSRRLERDARERGSDREYILRQFENDVKPTCEKYILPFRRFADIEISGEDSLEKSAFEVISILNGKFG